MLFIVLFEGHMPSLDLISLNPRHHWSTLYLNVRICVLSLPFISDFKFNFHLAIFGKLRYFGLVCIYSDEASISCSRDFIIVFRLHLSHRVSNENLIICIAYAVYYHFVHFKAIVFETHFLYCLLYVIFINLGEFWQLVWLHFLFAIFFWRACLFVF